MKRTLFSLSLLFIGVFAKGQVPVVTIIGPASSFVCLDSSITLTAIATNNPTQYIWQFLGETSQLITINDDTTYSGSTTNSLTIRTNTFMMRWGAFFQCIAVNSFGSSIPSSFDPGIDVIEVPHAPSNIVVGQTTIVCAGANDVAFGSPSRGAANQGFKWRYSGNDVTMTTHDSIVKLNFGPLATSGNLSVAVFNKCGTGAFTAIPITVNPIQALPAAVSGGSAICNSYTASPSGSIYSDPSTCSPISAIAPSGANPVSGSIQSCVTVDANVQSFGGIPYVPRHYSMEPSSGAATSTATVTLYFTQGDFDAYNAARGSNPALPINSSDAAGIAHLHVTQFHGTGTTPDTYVGGSGDIDPDDNNIIWNAAASRWEVTFDITGFSGFFVSSGSLVPLPVTLADFSGKVVEQGNELRWATSLEENTAYFEVQKAGSDGVFKDWAKVAAAGNSHQLLQYSYVDASGGSGSYRLEMVDFDGHFTYSKIVVLGTASGLFVRVSPNPAHQPQSLIVGSPVVAGAVLTVTDISGKKVVEKRTALQKGENSLDPGILARLPQGIYVIGVATDKQQQTIKFVKE